MFRAVMEQIAEALINAAAALLSPAAQVRRGCGFDACRARQHACRR